MDIPGKRNKTALQSMASLQQRMSWTEYWKL